MLFQTLRTTISATAVAALMAVGLASGANAAVVTIDPGDTNVLVADTTYRTRSEEKTPGVAFTDDYFFDLPDLGAEDGKSRVLYSYDVTFPIPEGAADDVGIADLTFTVSDDTNETVLNETVLTDGDGFVFPGFESGFNFAGVWPAPIDLSLTVTGTTLGQGGSYAATVAPTAAIPLPAPLILLGSALVGLGILGRRRFNA